MKTHDDSPRINYNNGWPVVRIDYLEKSLVGTRRGNTALRLRRPAAIQIQILGCVQANSQPMANPHITRTLGPIHFEDLDPHRFEDLVRHLIYDFKQWQSIESTGRGGADEGFDIRAYEIVPPSTPPDDEDPPEDAPNPMEGNLWMIQCKREKKLGPKRVASIVSDAVRVDNAPYGYILVAPVHFSKMAHDKFREELRNRGVMEFYLWGAGELEDMLYQPKNDHILFAFFGISLASRRRSRTTEIRSTVNVKNKLRRVLGDNPIHQSVLLRDLQDVHYPYEDEYKNFDQRPRWKAYSAVEFHPLGLIVSVARHYAYIDKQRAEWDFTKSVNTIMPVRGHHPRHRDVEKEELNNSVKAFWQQLPRTKRATFVYNGFVRFDSITFVDDKGDAEYDCPHLFVDSHSERGPFSGGTQYLEINEYHHESLQGLQRIEIFPRVFAQPTFGTIYGDKFISVDDRTRATLRHHPAGVTLYYPDEKYDYLKPTDVISVEKSENPVGERTLLKITNVRVATGEELLSSCQDNPLLQQEIEDQLSRQIGPSDRIRVIEALVIYDWQIEQNRPVI